MYIGWSYVTVICGHITIAMLWIATAYCMKLSGEDLSRYSNKIESFGLRKCPYYHRITRKWHYNNKHFSELAPHHGWENSWHRCGMKKLRHGHPTVYTLLSHSLLLSIISRSELVVNFESLQERSLILEAMTVTNVKCGYRKQILFTSKAMNVVIASYSRKVSLFS